MIQQIRTEKLVKFPRELTDKLGSMNMVIRQTCPYLSVFAQTDVCVCYFKREKNQKLDLHSVNIVKKKSSDFFFFIFL